MSEVPHRMADGASSFVGQRHFREIPIMVLLVLQRFSALDAALTLTTPRDVVLAATLLPKVVSCSILFLLNPLRRETLLQD